MKKAIVLFVCAIALAGIAATNVAAGDMTKLGSGTLMSDDNDVTIKKDTEVSTLVFRVKKHQVSLSEVTVAFADGTEKTVESLQKLRPGIDSEPIELGATGAIATVTLKFDTRNWEASRRAPITIYGS